MKQSTLPRSYLYVPGNAADKLTRALERGADALIIDLEDAVPVSEKDSAREAVTQWVGSLPETLDTEIWVRINPGELLLTDAAALANLPRVTGLAIAKCESIADVLAVDAVLTSAGDSKTLLMPLIETPRAVIDAEEIARGPRVHQLQIGEVDLAAELGITTDDDASEMAAYRAMIVLASTAAQINPPLGAVSRITSDAEQLGRSTNKIKRQGFVGRACIHPAQIPVVHETFTPTPEEVAEAREVVEAYDGAQARGSGVVLDSSGRLIDLAVLRSARKVLALAKE